MLSIFHLMLVLLLTPLYVISVFGGVGISALAFGTRPKPSAFSGRQNPQRTFLRKGSKTVGSMSLIYGMYKIPRRFVDVGVSAKLIDHFSPT
jgi:hypothetical protein